jgi:hypothetical protein
MVTENSVYISYYSVVFEEKMNEKTLAHHKIWKETQGPYYSVVFEEKMNEKTLAHHKIWKETQGPTHYKKIFLRKGRYT